MNPPCQELVAKDLHGKEWSFRHIYRGMTILDFTRFCMLSLIYFIWSLRSSTAKFSQFHLLAFRFKQGHLAIVFLNMFFGLYRSSTQAPLDNRLECFCKSKEACCWGYCDIPPVSLGYLPPLLCTGTLVSGWWLFELLVLF